ncbi:MAG: hypothetical protein WD069_21740 [Planctomycetales bacterium]
MKRWIVHGVIAGYLFALGGGVFAHALKFKHDAHPAMYFLVWDMFCGWAAYSTRIHIIGEGESGQFYELAPAPWGEFKPFGRLGRRHYDVAGVHAPRIALNCLAHTRHEPMARIFVVEEAWAKKHNLPDEIWAVHSAEAKPERPYSYFQVLKVAEPDGTLAVCSCNWLNKQVERCVADNPRLRADPHRGKPLFAPRAGPLTAGRGMPLHFDDPLALTPPGALLGN